MTDSIDDDFDWGPSKTQLKKASLALQDLGEHLTQMSDNQLARLPLDEELLAAIKSARAMKANAARKRQIQYIGKLIRNSNSDEIQATLAELDAEQNNSHQLLQLVDHWCTRLIDQPQALGEFLDQYAQVERQQLRNLLRNCKSPAAENIASPAYKKLRQWLRVSIQQHEAQ